MGGEGWRSVCPWWVLLAGVVLGQVIGFSPLLFVVLGLLCLGAGWLTAP